MSYEETYTNRRFFASVAVVVLLALVLAACAGCNTPRPQKGGGATTIVPPNSVEQALMQPENPEGSSEIFFEEMKQTVYPDGRIESTGRKAGTTVGGSQDYAKILREYGKTEMFKGLLLAFGLSVMAYFAYRRGWPLVAGCFFLGATLSILWVWWAGIVCALAGVALYIGFKMGLPVDPTELFK